MNVNSLVGIPGFSLLNKGNMDLEIKTPFCCDLLSIAMSKAPANAAWVTIMGNINMLRQKKRKNQKRSKRLLVSKKSE